MNANNSKHIKILIVEDEAILAKSLEDSLISMGYTVSGIADSGIKAIMLFFSTEPDLILMDIRIKGAKDGIEVADNIRQQKSVPIVFLTANQDPATFERAKIEGAFGYVLKPYQERELQIVIEIALNQFEMRKKNFEMELSLLNAEKLGTIGTLSAGIIHDINAPLSNIYASLDLIYKNLKDSDLINDPKFTKSLNKIEKGAQAIKSTVQNYRGMIDKNENEESIMINIKNILKDAFEVCSYLTSEKKIKFIELSSSPDSYVYFGKVSLFQVLVNLIRNACDAIENLPDAWIKITWEDINEKFLKILIVDSGSGIPENIREKIFDTLFTTKKPGKGTGLGLSLSKIILEKFGGKIELDAECPNTCFVLTLPKEKIN
ncbi:sensor histidine kinase [Fluviispira sanaruensis]|uniref:histidine kinase n=1 Tax=Fluviispira sanaruensis TaxID=2493639 RepID=A0A4P2VVT0_FLUSA|nr:response regulator [Fluviispira sanaruensis]BBH53032.1 hybrid sensor histidine kinase/response regulator [Fluviispira sanaruensis]